MKNPVTWSKKLPTQHDTVCQCEECEAYRRAEAAWIQCMIECGEFDAFGNVVEHIIYAQEAE